MADLTDKSSVVRTNNGRGTLEFGDPDEHKITFSDLQVLELQQNHTNPNGDNQLAMRYSDVRPSGNVRTGTELVSVPTGQSVTVIAEGRDGMPNIVNLPPGGSIVFNRPESDTE